MDTPEGAYRNMRHSASCASCVMADRLEVLSARVAGLSPSRRDPEQFHMDKSEVAHALRLLGRELRRAPR